MSNCRFMYDNFLDGPGGLSLSSARGGAVGTPAPEALGSATCYALGPHTGEKDQVFVVEIDSVAKGSAVGEATFRWKRGVREGWEASGLATSSQPITLADGVRVKWAPGQGQEFFRGDRWSILAVAREGAGVLTDRDRDTAWRALGCAVEWAMVDLGRPRRVKALVLADHNLSTGASATLKASGIAYEPIWSFDPAGGELVDSLGNPGVNARATGRTYLDGGVLKYAEPGESCFEDGRLSIQPAATNLLPYSDDLDNASAWSAVNAAVTAEGGLFRLSNNAVSGYHYLTPGTKTVGESVTNTMTVDAKAGTAGVLIISESIGSWNRVRFNLNSGTIENEDNATGKIVALADGWHRCSATFATPAGQSSVVWWLEVALAGQGYGSYAGSGEYIYLRRPQLEIGPVPTAYIPTTAAPASRDADAISFAMPAAVAAALGAAGSVAAEWTPGFDWDEMPAVAYHGVVSCTEAALSLLSIRKDASYFRIVTYDGAHLVDEYVSPACGNAYDLAARWGSSGQYQVGHGSSWGTANTFDGAYAVGSKLNFGYGVSLPFHLGRVKIFGQWLDGEPRALMAPWDYPAYSQALEITRPHLVLFLDQAHRFWRLELADADNPEGFLEASLLYLGGCFQPARAFGGGYQQALVAGRRLTASDAGKVAGAATRLAASYTLGFSRLSPADAAALEEMLAVARSRAGGGLRPVFFTPFGGEPENTLYCLPAPELERRQNPGGRWDLGLGLEEVTRSHA